jgi:rod shape-determining protein MreC
VIDAKKKKILLLCATFAGVLLIASSIAFWRTIGLSLLRLPLSFARAARQEVGALVCFHRNYREIVRLSRELDLCRSKLNGCAEAVKESERIRMLLGFSRSAPYKVIGARVIGRDPSNWSSVLLVDKGLRQGVRKGFVCVTYLGLVGRVVEAKDTVSKVMLISDPNLSVSAMVQRSRQEGLVSGSLSGSLIMKYLPHGSDIKVADVVITSGLTANYPKGIMIGTVTGIGDDFSGLSHYAVIKPSVNTANLEEVLLIVP